MSDPGAAASFCPSTPGIVVNGSAETVAPHDGMGGTVLGYSSMHRLHGYACAPRDAGTGGCRRCALACARR